MQEVPIKIGCDFQKLAAQNTVAWSQTQSTAQLDTGLNESDENVL